MENQSYKETFPTPGTESCAADPSHGAEPNPSRPLPALVGRGNTLHVQGLPFQPLTGEWLVDTDGVSRGSQLVCRAPMLLTRRMVSLDGSSPEKVELMFWRDGVPYTLWVLHSQYSDPTKLAALRDEGLPITRSQAGKLGEYLNDFDFYNRARMPVVWSVGRLGWTEMPDGSWQLAPWLPDAQPMYGDEFAPLMRALRPRGSAAVWVAVARQLRAQNTVLRVMLAASFASVLVKPVGALPFFCHLWGPTGCGKTVALRAAASVWADPMGGFIKNFNSTSVGFERTAHFLNNLPFCIDELQLARKEKGKVSFNPYELAEGQGRTRGTKTGGVEETANWSLAVLTSGESPLNPEGSGAGARNRVIELHWAGPQPLMQQASTYMALLEGHHGHAGPEFARRLAQPGALDEAKRLYRQYADDLRDGRVTDKQAEAAALLLTADTLVCRWLLDLQPGETDCPDPITPPLTPAELLPYLATADQVHVGRRAYEHLCCWVVQERDRFHPHSAYGPTYGVVEDGWAYIIANQFNAVCRDAGFDPDAVRSELKGMGVLRAEKGRATVTKRIRGTQVRCVCMKLEQEAFVEVSDADDPFCYACA